MHNQPGTTNDPGASQRNDSNPSRLFEETDLLRFAFVGDPVISPDGRRVAYVQTVIDPEHNRYLSRIMVQELRKSQAEAEPVALTHGPGADFAPAWSPDGRYLAFLSDREADKGQGQDGNATNLGSQRSPADKDKLGAQIYLLRTDGGEARRITDLMGGIDSFRWSPDGSHLAFVARVREGGPVFLSQVGLPEQIATQSGSPDAGCRDDDHKHDGCKDDGEPPELAAPAGAELWARWERKFNGDVREISRRFYRLDGEGWFEDKRSQVFVLNVAAAWAAAQWEGAGRAEHPLPRPVQITYGPYDHDDVDWSPDGRWLAVSACRTGDPDYQRFTDIWLFASDGQGQPTQLTRSLGPAECPRFSPDGRTLAYLGHERQKGWYTNTQIWLVNVGPDGTPSSAPRSLTRQFDRSFGDWSAVDMRRSGPGALLKWFPDGRFLCCLASDRGTTQLYQVNAVSGDVQPLTQGDHVLFTYDLWFGQPAAADQPAKVAQPAQAAEPAGADQPADSVQSPQCQSATGPSLVLVAGVGTPGDPGELYVSAGSAKLELRPLTAVNQELLRQRVVVYPQHITCPIPTTSPGTGPADASTSTSTNTNVNATRTSAGQAQTNTPVSEGGGDAASVNELDVWVIPPAHLEPGRKYPAVLEIHGGPQMMYTGQFFFEFQVLAAAGIGVIFCNPRGGAGYGEDFCADIRGDWGNHDYADVMAAVDAAIAHFNWIDPERLGVAGGSYGGFMTSWIIGHTQRFRAAVSMRAVNNLFSMFGTSDTGALWDEVFGGTPWENVDNYRRQSPLAYAAQIQTPTLILHSEEDYRCPIEQGEQLYAALKYRGVETKMVRYPNESHGLSRGGKPWHRVHRLNQIRRWFVDHLSSPTAAQQQPESTLPSRSDAPEAHLS